MKGHTLVPFQTRLAVKAGHSPAGFLEATTTECNLVVAYPDVWVISAAALFHGAAAGLGNLGGCKPSLRGLKGSLMVVLHKVRLHEGAA